MKKTLLTASLFIATAFFTLPALAEPAQAPVEGTPVINHPPRHEHVIQKPDFDKLLLNNTALKLTEKQKKDIEKSSKATKKKVAKADKQIQKAIEKKQLALKEHFDTIQNTLTDEQKAILKEQRKQKMEERKAKFEEFKKAHPDFKKDGKRPHHFRKGPKGCKKEKPVQPKPAPTTK